jgi:hypothetical protein
MCKDCDERWRQHLRDAGVPEAELPVLPYTPPPFVKVTEVTGRYYLWCSEEGISEDSHREFGLKEILPPEATREDPTQKRIDDLASGWPRMHYRITVEARPAPFASPEAPK